MVAIGYNSVGKMPAITLKNIPDKLYEKIKKRVS